MWVLPHLCSLIPNKLGIVYTPCMQQALASGDGSLCPFNTAVSGTTAAVSPYPTLIVNTSASLLSIPSPLAATGAPVTVRDRQTAAMENSKQTSEHPLSTASLSASTPSTKYPTLLTPFIDPQTTSDFRTAISSSTIVTTTPSTTTSSSPFHSGVRASQSTVGAGPSKEDCWVKVSSLYLWCAPHCDSLLWLSSCASFDALLTVFKMMFHSMLPFSL